LVSGMLHLFGFVLDYDEHDFGTDLDSGEYAGEVWRFVSSLFEIGTFEMLK
jgi:hypothetical protein